MMVHSLKEPEELPCFNADEFNPSLTWQFILAAQLADPVTAWFIQDLSGRAGEEMIAADECSDEFKVLTSQFHHLSLAGEDDSRSPGIYSSTRSPGSSHPPQYDDK